MNTEKQKPRGIIHSDSLRHKFRLMFILFALIAIAITGIATWITQTQLYRGQYSNRLHNINTFTVDKITEEGEDFAWLQSYFDAHMPELKIPLNYAEVAGELKAEFAAEFSLSYPGMAMWRDVTPSELPEDLQLLYARCLYIDWLITFDKIRDDNGLLYAYYVYPLPQQDHMCYMFDILRESETVDGEEVLSVGYDAFQDRKQYANMWKANDTGLDPVDMDVYENEFGHVYTYSMPVVQNGKTLGVFMTDISFSLVERQITRSVITLVVISLVILGLCSLLMMVFVERTVLKRLFGLERHVQTYSRDKDPAIADAIDKDSVIHDEIGALSDSFSEMIRQLQDYMVNLQHVTAEKERIGAELSVATEIQASMLPRIFPAFPEREEFEIFASMDPAKEVGGDFFDFFMKDDDHLAVVIADVSGKGVPAALFMAISKALIKDQGFGDAFDDPAAILGMVNNQLCENNDREFFVTVWLGILDLKTGLMRFADAGHEYPVLIHADGSTDLVKATRKKPPVATMEGIRYVNSEVQLVEGDTLFLYTDGVPEATDAHKELYGMDRLLETLKQNYQLKPADLLPAVRKNVDAFVGEAEQFDDLTMLGLKIHKIG